MMATKTTDVSQQSVDTATAPAPAPQQDQKQPIVLSDEDGQRFKKLMDEMEERYAKEIRSTVAYAIARSVEMDRLRALQSSSNDPDVKRMAEAMANTLSAEEAEDAPKKDASVVN